MDIQERLRNLNAIDWAKVPDEDLRLAYYMLKEHHVFEDIVTEVVQEMSYRMQNGGFCAYPRSVKPVTRDVPDFMYKWPFCLLWRQNPNGEKDDDVKTKSNR